MSAALLAALAGAALVTSTISGILGMAGGVTLLGIMTALLPATAVVPLHGVVQLSSNFTRTLAFFRHVQWRFVALYAPFLIIGVTAATWTWTGEKLTYFRPGIGAFILLFLVWRRKAPRLRHPPDWAYPLLGVVTGFSSIWIGATGPLIAPFFLRDDFEKEQVIATKAACQAMGHVLKIPAFLALGFDFSPHVGTLLLLVVCVVMGTFIGKTVLSKLKNQTFVLLFEGVLALLALYLLLGPVLQSAWSPAGNMGA